MVLARGVYDYIVVGAGSAGCAMAARLAERGKQVLLLEAGSKDTNPVFRVPLLSILHGVLVSRKYNWRYFSEPEPALEGRTIYQPRGRLFGGSSSINGMIWVRGHPRDYDGWAELSNDPSWSYEALLPYFRASESKGAGGATTFRGGSGPLRVSPLRWNHPLSSAFMSACCEAGLKQTDDFNSGNNTEGVGFYEMNQHEGLRVSASHAYLWPNLHRDNLHVKPDSLVTRVLLNGQRAVGVEFEPFKGGPAEKAEAPEVVLCGGVFNSPQLLNLSGIGPRPDLEAAGISCIHNLPGVGKNLQDHLDIGVEVSNPSCESLALSPWALPMMLRAPLQFVLQRSGPLTSNGVDAGGYLKSSKDIPYEDLQMHFFPGSFRDYKAAGLLGHRFALNVYLSRPRSRGTAKIVSGNPREHLQLHFNFLEEKADQEALISGVRQVREILKQPALAKFRGVELLPGDEVDSDQGILSFIKKHCKSAHHPIGTCKMGLDDHAVVDADLRVHGIDGLSIVDSSIMPTHVTSNPYSTVMAIAEKASDKMLAT